MTKTTTIIFRTTLPSKEALKREAKQNGRTLSGHILYLVEKARKKQ